MGSTDLSMVAVLWKNRTNIGDKAVIINSILEEGVHVGSRSVVSHSYLGNNIKISKDSLVAGVNLQDAEVGDLQYFLFFVLRSDFWAYSPI